MYYEIVTIQHVKNGGPDDYYLLVDVWCSREDYDSGAPRYYQEDFWIRRKATGRQIVRNESGWWLATGVIPKRWWAFWKKKETFQVYVDPNDELDFQPDWVYEDVRVDLKAEFVKVIETTLRNRENTGVKGTLDNSLQGDGIELLTWGLKA